MSFRFFFFFFGLYPKCNQNLVTGFKQGFPNGSVVKNTPVMQKLQVQSFGREDPLQKAMATHSSILSWESLWTEEPGRLQSMGSQKSDTTEQLKNNTGQMRLLRLQKRHALPWVTRLINSSVGSKTPKLLTFN